MLTDMQIRQAKYEGKPQKMFDGEGLYVLISKKSKRWYLRYTFEGKKVDRALGRYPILSLLEARKIAIDTQISIKNGIDPLAKDAADSVTFDAAYQLLYALDEKRLSADTMRNRQLRYTKYIKATLGNKKLTEITPQHVRDIVLPLHDAGKETTAKRVRIIIGQIYRDGIHRYGLTYDPSQASQRLPKYKRTKHHPHIENKRLLGRLMADIASGDAMTSSSIHTALLLLPYVFVRPVEMRFAKAEDIDLEEGIWRIPVGNNKNRRIHTVPLAKQVQEILGKRIALIRGNSPYLFASPVSQSGVISEGSMNKYLSRLGYPGRIITPHGFRGTASTLLHEMGYESQWIETQLDHAQQDEVAASYNHARYLKQRRLMMQDWADFLDDLREKFGGIKKRA